jgi:hypothetical protein
MDVTQAKKKIWTQAKKQFGAKKKKFCTNTSFYEELIYWPQTLCNFYNLKCNKNSSSFKKWEPIKLTD